MGQIIERFGPAGARGIQRRLKARREREAAAQVQAAADDGTSGASGPLPHLDTIQKAFGPHDVSHVKAHTDDAASAGAQAMGAQAFAAGDHVAFDGTPDLHTAAHEAAHVVQQRGGVQLKGGVGEAGDAYEQHADAVADRVVAGGSAVGLLDQMSPAPAASHDRAGAAVQRKETPPAQDIKSDLRAAMKGWGTDEDRIFARVARATPAEIQSIIDDAKLMEELRKELSKGDMERLCDQMAAPLPYKLRLAMRGWGNDNGYIMRSLNQASAAELQQLLADGAMMQQLQKELGRGTLMQVMQRLNAPLQEKLKAAMKGWGRDESFMFQSVATAPLDQVLALAHDQALQRDIDSEMSSADGNRFRAQVARRIFLEGGAGQAEWAFYILQGLTVDDKKLSARLAVYGSLAEQRTLCDAVIHASNDADRARQAFQMYWQVEMGAQDGATMKQWPLPVLREMHEQLKRLPAQDVRAGVWKKLSLSDQHKIDPTSGQDVGLSQRAAYGDGNFIVGTQATPGGTSSVYGISTALNANSAAGATTIEVLEGARLKTGDNIVVDRGGNEDKAKITNVAGNTWTLESGLTHRHFKGEKVEPDDITQDKGGSWLSATVRHEIAHAVDAQLRSTVSQFQKNQGGWWTGEDIQPWISAMDNPWKTNDGSVINKEDQDRIKEAITAAVKSPKGSLFTQYGLKADHPLLQNQGKGVPVIEAAEICLANGDQFFNQAPALHSSNGKVFMVSFWYNKFMYCKEVVRSSRENNYTLYAPTEFFAETYTTFYEEAGQPNITEEMLGRRVRNAEWREWIRDNIHNRGLAPKGAGKGAGAVPGSGTGRKAMIPGP